MLLKIFMFLTGIFLSALSLMFITMYSNLLIMGYSFYEYVNFIIRRVECLIIIIGIILIVLSMRKEKKK